MLLSLAEQLEREGRPHLVTVLGQAGVGKSRLLRELTERAAELDPAPAVEIGECPPFGSGISYWALAEVLRSQFGIAADEPADSAWEKLRASVGRLLGDEVSGEEAERIIAPIGVVLGLESTEASGGEAEDPQRMRETLFSSIRTLTERMCAQQPLLLAIEDIHWADEGMLDLIEHLARWVRGPLLIVCLARDELLDRRPDWGGGRRNATSIALEPLSEDETERLVGSLYEGNGGDAGLVARVAQRAGGNPLFAEEMVNRLQEPDADPEALPDTVHSVLAARLDSLPAFERRLLQYASVIGQNFWEGVLLRASGAEDREVSSALASLEQKELVIGGLTSRLVGEREYAFKHALIRDVAYGMLPKASRCRQHFAVGGLIEERAEETGEGAVALVAEHYGRAASLGAESGIEADEMRRISEPALQFAEAAGDAAAALYSNREALGHYRAARSLEGVIDEESSARIGEKTGDVALRLGRVDEAISVWEECLAYHRRQEDLARVGDLHCKIGAAHWDKGEREASIEHYQRGIDLLKDGPPVHRAGPPLRGGRLALHAHRRQHARDLRLREGAAPRRTPRRGGRREPRPRDLRPGLRPDRGLREGAREPGAIGRAGPRLRQARGGAGPAHPRLPPRGLRGRLQPARGAPTRRRSAWRSRPVTSPRRSRSTRRWPSSPSTPPTGMRSSGRPRRAPGWPSARG